MSLRPTGSRVIIKPEPAATESAGGIVFPETAGQPPAMSGTVISIARGPASAHRVRQYTLARVMELIEELADNVPASALRSELQDAIARMAVDDVSFSEISEGDYVAFAYTSGAQLVVDGETYIVLDEQEIQAVWSAEESAA